MGPLHMESMGLENQNHMFESVIPGEAVVSLGILLCFYYDITIRNYWPACVLLSV